MRPGGIDFPAAALLSLPDQPLPYPSHHQVRQLHQVERVDADLGIRQLLADGLLNAADGSITTTSSRFRQAGCGPPASHRRRRNRGRR
jgi:hypothetical protein